MKYNIVDKIISITGNNNMQERSFFESFFRNINVDPTSVKYDEQNKLLTMIGNNEIFINIKFNSNVIKLSASKENCFFEESLYKMMETRSYGLNSKMNYNYEKKYTKHSYICFKNNEGIYCYSSDSIVDSLMYYDSKTLEYLDKVPLPKFQKIANELFIEPDIKKYEQKDPFTQPSNKYFFNPQKMIDEINLELNKKTNKKK